MDEKLKEILSKHWWFLVRYMEPNKEMINLLKDGNVLPSAMIDDIQLSPTKKEKNERLLLALKLRGNTAYRNFRDILMKCGQVFIADLLFEEDRDSPPLVEESDLHAVPQVKLNLNPEDVKRITSFIDAKVKYRVLKYEWKNNSVERYQSLQLRQEQYTHGQCHGDEARIKSLCGEIATKNDLLRAMSLEVNTLNHEINEFLRRHKVLGANHVTTKFIHSQPPSEDKKSRFRFRQFEINLDISIQRLSNLLGEANNDSSGTLEELNAKTKQIQGLVRELESKIYHAAQDRSEAVGLLKVNPKGDDTSALDAVQIHIEADRKDRMSLLKAIDQLSRRLRGMSSLEPSSPCSGLCALRQSAVTGNPSAETVDYRFLMNHLALIEADAEHIAKRLTWKDVEVKALRAEVMSLRRRYGCRDSSPDFMPSEAELGD